MNVTITKNKRGKCHNSIRKKGLIVTIMIEKGLSTIKEGSCHKKRSNTNFKGGQMSQLDGVNVTISNLQLIDPGSKVHILLPKRAKKVRQRPKMAWHVIEVKNLSFLTLQCLLFPIFSAYCAVPRSEKCVSYLTLNQSLF